jgi:hypothetical protein
MAARLKEKYHKEIKQALQKELGLDNPMAVPELDKIVVNMGLGEATQNTKLLDPLVADLAQITRAEAGDHQGQEVDCGLQGEGRHVDRRHGDAAQREGLRVS